MSTATFLRCNKGPAEGPPERQITIVEAKTYFSM
jgi:hypothetical protein